MASPPNNLPTPTVSPPPTLAYIFCLCGMGLLAVVAILGIQLVRPKEDNTVLIGQVLTVLTPTTAALIGLIHNGAKINDVHILMNSRLTELLAETRISARSQGRDEERASAQGRDEERASAQSAIPPAGEPALATPVPVTIQQPEGERVPVSLPRQEPPLR